MTEISATAAQIDWPALLEPHGARFNDDGQVVDFGDATAEQHAVLGDGGAMPLTHQGIIRVVGDDAASFLHAQLSQSIEDQPPGETRLAGYCNPKGRLLALFRVIRLDQDDFLLFTHQSLMATLVKRLQMFVLRSRVALQDFTPYAGIWGATGSAAAALSDVAGTLPQGIGTATHAGDTTVVNLGGDKERFLVLAHARDAQGIWQAMTAASRPVTPAAWELLQIRAGEPGIAAAVSEHFVPQQVNLDLIEGIDFQKGCYPGQEVVARMHYRGKPSRRMFGLAAPGDTAPLPGDSVTTADGASVGEVVQAVVGPAGIEALAVLRLQYRDRQDLRIGDQPAGFAQLPYQVPITPEPDETETESS